MVDPHQSERAVALLHRRPAYAVNAPALLRHRCYRASELIEAATVDQAAQRSAQLVENLNHALLAIQERCGATPRWSFRVPKGHKAADETARQEAAAGERTVDHRQTMLLNLPVADAALPGWRARICVDLHGEYYAVTFILDQPEPQAPGDGTPEPVRQPGGRGQGAGPDLSADLFRSAAHEMSRLGAGSETDAANAERHYAEYRRYLDWWYREIWDCFDRHALAPEPLFPGSVFAEFYGMAMQTSGPSDIGVDPASSHDPIIWPRMSDEKSRREELYRWVNNNRDFLRGVLQLDCADDGVDRDANCVLCTMLWGTAIYGSALGRPLAAQYGEAATGGSRPMPLHYFVISHGWSKYLLGRILRRLQTLGELRSAAVLDLPRLDGASDRMRALRNQIDESLHTRDPNRDSATLEQRHLRLIQGSLNEIADSHIDGGLLARVSRSRHYAQDFKQRMKDMGFGPIDGWEPYDVFMHRNLYKTLEYIDGIGTRFEGLASTVQRLTAARNLYEVAEVEKDIAHIQRIGEIIGWTAFAYYGGQILDKFMPMGPHECAVRGLPWLDFCHALHEHWGTAITTVVAIWAWQHFRKQQKMRAAGRAPH